MAQIPDSECVRFLQELLPGMGYRWAGFRRVRRQVRNRLRRRIDALGLSGLDAYRAYLDEHADERALLDTYCRISISRFHRGIKVFEAIRSEVLPAVAAAARDAGESLRCWSAGCASGEEPYSLTLAWQLDGLAKAFPDVDLRVLATDANPHMLERARAAEYTGGSLKDAPPEWRAAFEARGGGYWLPPHLRAGVELRLADVREPPPDERFRLVLCRYLVFTYFAPELQATCLRHLLSVLEPGGYLVTAPKEELPSTTGLRPLGNGRLGIYERPC